jgi:hypothetical protein
MCLYQLLAKATCLFQMRCLSPEFLQNALARERGRARSIRDASNPAGLRGMEKHSSAGNTLQGLP